MRKLLVIGCGGSGAKTLAYMMDQLKTMLAERYPEKHRDPKNVTLPQAWQFVLIDTPSSAESMGQIPNVADAGGTYISCSSTSRLGIVDDAVSKDLGREGALGSIGTWALPDPHRESTPITRGAGQYRAIGRILTLSKLKEIQRGLQFAWNRAKDANDLVDYLSYGKSSTSSAQAAQNRDLPLIFVISSMSGGSGASMAIDVCRLLTTLNGAEVGSSSLFMVTPDAFLSIAEDQRGGANPNALAMFNELVAAQCGSAAESDRRTFRALGIDNIPNEIPVGRIFPVGASAGVSRTQLGDGRSSTVFRALGRGLAALALDEGAMNNYVAFFMGNRGGTPMRDSYGYGWGASADDIPWGSYGYSQLSMGRDRYAEYAAQRLARYSVNVLLEGHIDPTKSQDMESKVQLEKLIQRNQRAIAASFQDILPVAHGRPEEWVRQHFHREIGQWVQQNTEMLRRQIPPMGPERGSDLLAKLQPYFQQFNAQVRDPRNLAPVREAVQRWISTPELQEKFLQVLSQHIGEFGLEYADKIVENIRQELLSSSRHLEAAGAHFRNTPIEISQHIAGDMTSQRGRISDPSAYINRMIGDAQQALSAIVFGYFAQDVSLVFKEFCRDYLAPLQQSILQQHQDLVTLSREEHDPNLGLAQTKTDVPREWPEESDFVPSRFSQAANEIFLTDVDEFPSQYRNDISQSVQDLHQQGSVGEPSTFRSNYDDDLRECARRVIQGEWQTAEGKQPPRDLLILTSEWVPHGFERDPRTGQMRNVKPAAFDVRIIPKNILDRARQYVGLGGSSFHQFTSTSLRSFLLDNAVAQTEREDRQRRFLSKFTDAMNRALPLAGVNAQLVQSIYGTEVKYSFNFSTIPLDGSELAGRLQDTVNNFPHVYLADPSDPLQGALNSQGEERAIDIFGSYPKYVPIVFDSLMEPIREQYHSLRSTKEFWKARRARPLQAALPMSPEERKALIGGWFVGMLTGHLDYENTRDVPADAPVQVFDRESQRWLNFEAPLLTTPDRMKIALDWLPAILESAGLAWAGLREGYDITDSPIRPYQVLRSLYDDDKDGPTDSSRTLNAVRLLNDWLFEGVTGALSTTFQETQFSPAGATAEDRRDNAIAYLEKLHGVAEAYTPMDILTKGGLRSGVDHPYGDVRDRHIAANLPLLADIAPDVLVMSSTLIELISTAYEAGPRGFERRFSPLKSTVRSDSSSRMPMPGEDL